MTETQPDWVPLDDCCITHCVDPPSLQSAATTAISLTITCAHQKTTWFVHTAAGLLTVRQVQTAKDPAQAVAIRRRQEAAGAAARPEVE
ncbi:MAG TPA: hypothetical protein VNM48_00445 [Chloroflexota bacterium]|nr:hypothetical protein [Chloroflexota bacterium]